MRAEGRFRLLRRHRRCESRLQLSDLRSGEEGETCGYGIGGLFGYVATMRTTSDLLQSAMIGTHVHLAV